MHRNLRLRSNRHTTPMFFRAADMRLDHINIATDDLDGSIAFYRDVLGLTVGPRPDFPFAGAWVYAEERPIVHLKAPGAEWQVDAAIDHAAFYTDDFAAFVARLDRLQIAYRLQVLPDASLRQCFIRDPNGARLEITGR